MEPEKQSSPIPAPAPRNDKKRRGAWRKLLPWTLGILLLALIVAGLWPKPVPVETASVTRGPLVVTVFEEGKTRIRHRHVVSPPVAGNLRRVELRAGAPIEAGKTVLAVLEPEHAGFLDPRTLAQAEARLQGVEATKQLRQAELDRATSVLDLAQKDFARADSLIRTRAISTQQWDTARNLVEVRTRELHAAEFARRVADFEIAQAKAALLQSQPPTEEGGKPLEILSPVTGYVLNVYEESARVVTPGTALMEVGDPRDLEAEIELLSSDAVGVQPGADVAIEQWGGDTPLRGRVTLVERGGFTKFSALGVEEQRVKVRVDFLDPLPPGKQLGDRYRVEARIVTWQGKEILQVPAGALFRRGSRWMAFVVRDGKAALREVEIAHHNGVAAEVLGGLAESDEVILHPPDSITEGAAVAVQATAD
jgi:HlyD family secretion protein